MSEPIEWTCEGCGRPVIGFGYRVVPRSGFCSTCEWANEFVPDPEEMIALLRSMGNLEEHPTRRREQHDATRTG